MREAQKCGSPRLWVRDWGQRRVTFKGGRSRGRRAYGIDLKVLEEKSRGGDKTCRPTSRDRGAQRKSAVVITSNGTRWNDTG